MSDISPLYFLIPTGVSSPSSRITVPLSPAQRRSNVPYQMLLLLEEMQCGKCKAVGPTELARCLAEHRVKCKQPLPGAHLCSAHSNISPRNPEIPGVTQCSLQLPPSWVQWCVLIVKRGKKTQKNQKTRLDIFADIQRVGRLSDCWKIELWRAERTVHCLICLAALAPW